MTLFDILSTDDIFLDLEAGRRRDAIRLLSDALAARHGLEPETCYEALMAREQLGSTGLGRGIALPHTQIKGLTRPVAAFARLRRPVEFGAPDEEPVDLVLMVLMPENAGSDQVKVLSRVARLLREDEVTSRLRAARDAEAVAAILAAPR